jgi:hypothetical protein
MIKLRSFRSVSWVLTKLALSCLALCGFAYGQILNQDQEIQVHNLPSLMARSHDASDVLLTSLDTVFHDREICCGKDSALEDSASAADPESLKAVASKLDGRHLLSDGRPIIVKAEYVAPDAVNSANLIGMILNQHAALIEWNSHLYVVHGVVYMWFASRSGPEGGVSEGTVIHKLLLWDTRYSDSRREVVFNRETDDWSKVQGLLFLEAQPQ